MANEAKARAKLEEAEPVKEPEEEEIYVEIPLQAVIEVTEEVEETVRKEPEMANQIGIGVVNYKNNFYNCTPIGVMEDGVFYPYSEEELDLLLPKSNLHNINFFFKYLEDSQVKFMRNNFYDGQLVWLNLEVDELKDNTTPTGERLKTGYRIDAEDGRKKGQIRALSDLNLYQLLPLSALKDDYKKKRAVIIDPEGVAEGEQVLVNLENGFYAGPFEVKRTPRDNALFIIMQPFEGKHFMYGYNSADCERVYIDPSYEVSEWVGNDRWVYYSIKEGAAQQAEDFISDKDLLEAFKESLEKEDEFEASKFDVESIVQKHGTTQIVGNSIPKEIRERRVEKLQQILSDSAQTKQFNDETADLVLKILLNNQENAEVVKIFEEILEKPGLMEQLQGVKAVRDKVDSTRAELEGAKAELDTTRAELEELEKKQSELTDRPSAIPDDLEEVLSEQIKEKQDELFAVCEQINMAGDVAGLQVMRDDLTEEVKNLDEHIKSLENDFAEKVKNSSALIANISVDGYVSNAMLKAAAQWEAKNESEALSAVVENMNEVTPEPMKAEELVDYLVKTIQIPRPGYDRNVIVNIITCISQGFLTVFSGLPGCGKTSICNIVSDVLGLNNYEKVSDKLSDVKRYVPVSVERGWTSKKDFIGYYNPLTKSFEENEKMVFDGLKILDEEKRKGYHKWPFLILLDEANLSPMEYYWADFMNVCDDIGDKSSINMGNSNIFRIPETLHFLATINNDHTTETLSPRLIDRAWIITLPKNMPIQYNQDIPKDAIRNVTWDEIRAVFTVAGYQAKGFDREAQAAYEGIKDILLQQEMYISPRSEVAIQNYWIVASKLMEEDEFGNSESIVALDYAIAQKVLTKINGSGEEYEQWLSELKEYCDSTGLTFSAEILGSIIKRGQRKMKYYKFFD